jgi:hypothetical protein
MSVLRIGTVLGTQTVSGLCQALFIEFIDFGNAM